MPTPAIHELPVLEFEWRSEEGHNNMIKSFKDAINGLKTVGKEERNFKLLSIFAVAVLVVAFYFDFSPTEFIFIIFAITLVLSGEVVNTAIEDLCNRVESNQDPVIGKVKDMMAGFVLLLSAFSLLVGVFIFCNHFYLHLFLY